MSYAITKNDYFDRTQPAKSEELVNLVNVPVAALTPDDAPSEVYRSADPVTLAAGATIEIIAEYSNCPVTGGAAVLEDASAGIAIDPALTNYYAWGAVVTIKNSGVASGVFTLFAKGTILNENSDEIVTDEDADSQLENGVLKYDYPKNHLVQSQETGAAIAAALLDGYKTPRKDVSLTWRGDPSLELGDIIEAPVYQRGAIDERAEFYIYKNKLDFDGTLRATTEARKVLMR